MTAITRESEGLAEAQVVYQISLKDGPASSAWVDVDEPTYKSAQLDSEYKCRILYTRKQWMAWKRCYEK